MFYNVGAWFNLAAPTHIGKGLQCHPKDRRSEGVEPATPGYWWSSAYPLYHLCSCTSENSECTDQLCEQAQPR